MENLFKLGSCVDYFNGWLSVFVYYFVIWLEGFFVFS